MALKNLEEAIVERIQLALAKELRRLRGESRSTVMGRPRARFW
jgi:hypothetical protein